MNDKKSKMPTFLNILENTQLIPDPSHRMDSYCAGTQRAIALERKGLLRWNAKGYCAGTQRVKDRIHFVWKLFLKKNCAPSKGRPENHVLIFWKPAW